MSQRYDVFICHASEDKDDFVRPLAQALCRLGISVWYDESSLELGDSISKEIDRGIAGARFGIVVISQSFIGKSWPDHELRGLVNRQVEEDLKIIPIWHGVTKTEVAKFSPSLADKLAINTKWVDAQEAAIKILRTVRPDLYRLQSRADLEQIASWEAITELQSIIDDLRAKVAEYQCPYCGSDLSTRIDAPLDPLEKHWDVIETYECGYQVFGGAVQNLCPSDPNFPSLEDYELLLEATEGETATKWNCSARPKTEMARKVRLDVTFGMTKEAAIRRMQANYHYRAGRISNAEWVRVQMEG
jgi:hypothetical protein